MRYSKKTSSYLERISLSDLSHMLSMVDPVVIGMKTLRIDNKCSLE